MINPQWLELPIYRTNFHGPKDVRAIEVRLYSDILNPYYTCPKFWRPSLTLLLLNTACLVLANSVDPHQLASEEALFVIKYVNFYQNPGSSNLIGWKLEEGVTS